MFGTSDGLVIVKPMMPPNGPRVAPLDENVVPSWTFEELITSSVISAASRVNVQFMPLRFEIWSRKSLTVSPIRVESTN